MMQEQIEVTEKMAKFIKWVEGIGEDETRKRIREKLGEIKEMPAIERQKYNFFWDIRLEPNDDPDQYHYGGDCNLCKRKKYCSTQCGANKVLKKITTPLLYQMYLDANPEAAAEEAAANVSKMTPDDVLKMVGVNKDDNEQPVS